MAIIATMSRNNRDAERPRRHPPILAAHLGRIRDAEAPLYEKPGSVVSAYGTNLQQLTVVFLAHLSLFFFVDLPRISVGRAQGFSGS